jgi:invasion protein IalB
MLALQLVWSAASWAQLSEGGQLFGDWVVHCDTQSSQMPDCRMSQMAVVESTSEPLLRINIRYQQTDGRSFIQFVLPLGISLHQDPILELDERQASSLPLDMCLQDGCYSTFALSPELLEGFLSMQAGLLTLHAGNGEPIELPISGKGSRAAFAAMQAMSKALSERQTN